MMVSHCVYCCYNENVIIFSCISAVWGFSGVMLIELFSHERTTPTEKALNVLYEKFSCLISVIFVIITSKKCRQMHLPFWVRQLQSSWMIIRLRKFTRKRLVIYHCWDISFSIRITLEILHRMHSWISAGWRDCKYLLLSHIHISHIYYVRLKGNLIVRKWGIRKDLQNFTFWFVFVAFPFHVTF